MQSIITTAKFRSVSQNSNETEMIILRNDFVSFARVHREEMYFPSEV